ncbi:hypothetical protein DRW48_10185 [Paracoccus suum]|uniref:Uncharacterized protein n=1 Tax=Paracoccus suum TaxID=2259340 RepID=A0A344PKV6_9RHOB|nr:hypothetical protein [Paracoccus suum]AXC50011.1 hypothetical protein DRW48_10185 [Paracoccus suum]
MSNNEPDLKKSARWHQPAIWGIGFAVLAAIIAAVVLLITPWEGKGTLEQVVPPSVTGPAGDTPAQTNTAPQAAPEGTAPATTGG